MSPEKKNPEKKKSKMTKAEIGKIRETLLGERAKILGDVSSLEDEALKPYEDEVSVDHMADHGSDSFEQDQTIGLIERESESLRAIAEALEKLDAGRYGICEECEKPIKKARLKALPYARLCLECQMAEEQTGG